jgi:negative regulator of flagellin synthesis FlgM
MRIDLFNTAASQAATQTDSNQSRVQTPTATQVNADGDRTTLTSGSVSISSLVSEAMNSPEIRQARVQSLQQAVSSGNYKLDPDAIAGAMIDEHA